MDAWSKYRQLGIWGLWREFFSASVGDWFLRLEFSGKSFLVNGRLGQIVAQNPNKVGEIFRWDSSSGFFLCLYANAELPQTVIDQWRLLLYFEAANYQSRPSFCPFCLSRATFAAKLNELIASPGQVLTLNGQPGVGKRTVLQGLSLLHAGRLAELDPQSINHWVTPSGEIWIVPELAMLETDVQERIRGEVSTGARLWAATAYDIGMLRARKILSPAFAELVADRRFHLAPVGHRGEDELRDLVDFWCAFYGGPKMRQVTNLEFLKQRTLAGGAQLLVGSILEEGSGLRGVIAEFEKEAIRQAYARVGRSQHKIARLLKVSRGSLQHKLRKYQMESYAAADTDNEEAGGA
jgi:hypothetical protein